MNYFEQTKMCTRCGIVKHLQEFVKNPKLRSGYGGHCRQCERERVSQWRAKNPGRDSERRRAYRAAHIEQELERVAHWKAENPQRVRETGWANSYRQRVRTLGSDPMVIPFTYEDVIDVYGDACYHCGGPFEHLDHWPVAVVEGGEHRLENVVPSCAPCNSAGAVEIRKRRRQAA